MTLNHPVQIAAKMKWIKVARRSTLDFIYSNSFFESGTVFNLLNYILQNSAVWRVYFEQYYIMKNWLIHLYVNI